MIESFAFSRIPNIVFGQGKLAELSKIILKYGDKIILVTGSSSLKQSGKWEQLKVILNNADIEYWIVSVDYEPDPQLIDNVITKFKEKDIKVVVGVGGGSVTDAAKAISAMFLKSDSIQNYLEGIGQNQHDGIKIPYIAIPTTSGTGSEATKNAVISNIGPEGFKKSLRHDNFVPDYALIDPELMLSCPSSITAACGLDAFTQLLEAYVSTKANPLTDALAYSGMNHIKESLIPASTTEALNINTRASMAYGSLLSGIALANAGLGIIHGLASPIGGFFKIPHGIVCATLLAECTKKNIQKLNNNGPRSKVFLLKYAKIGALLTNEKSFKARDIYKLCENLVSIIEKWTNILKIPRLGAYGIKEEDITKIIEYSSLKNNPVSLDKKIINEILLNRL